MCACNGTGGIHVTHSWGVSFHPCPDTNCEFDRAESDRKYEEWKMKVEEAMPHEHSEFSSIFKTE